MSRPLHPPLDLQEAGHRSRLPLRLEAREGRGHVAQSRGAGGSPGARGPSPEVYPVSSLGPVP